MAIIEINKETCTKCGVCAFVCGGMIIVPREGDYPRQVPGTDEFCMRCGHCVAVCPTGSLTHKDLPLEQCPPIDKKQEASFQQVSQLIKSRRSIREFQDKTVPREDIERIIDVARFSPTGHNMQEVQWAVINDRAHVRKLAAIGADWLRFMMKNNPGMAAMFEGTIKQLDAGNDVFLRDTPAIVIAFAEKNNPIAATDCAIALSYFDLTANTVGLGCCWAGFFYMAAGSYPAMTAAVGLPDDFTPYGALMVGYPKFKYQRIPVRKPARITYRP